MADKLLCDCETGVLPGEREDEEWQRFREVAHRAGFPSAVAAANCRALWDTPVMRAIEILEREAGVGP